MIAHCALTIFANVQTDMAAGDTEQDLADGRAPRPKVVSPTESQRLIYDAAWRKAEVFFEWRHKLITLAVGVVGGGLLAVAWLSDQNVSSNVVALVFLFMAALLLLTSAMDRRIATHMADAYAAGSAVEQALKNEMDDNGELPFTALLSHHNAPNSGHLHGRGGSLTTLLRRGYFSTALVLVALAGLVASGALQLTR